MTFATSTANRTQATVVAIEAQIAQLQEQLTELQERQQSIKSAEQQGLSAIAQFDIAIQAIASLDEPEMLSQFLEEMGKKTDRALSEKLPQLPDNIDVDASDEVEPEPVETESELGSEVPLNPDVPLVEDETPLVDDEDPLSSIFVKTKPGVEWFDVKFTDLKSYASKHGVKTYRQKKRQIEKSLEVSGHTPEMVKAWVDDRDREKLKK